MNVSRVITTFCNILIWFIGGLLLVNIFECCVLCYSQLFDISNCLSYSLLGFVYNVGYVGKISLAFFLLYFLGCRFSERVSKIILRVFLCIILLISCCLVVYFSIAGVPLDKVFFAYSLSEIMDIISSSQNAPYWTYLFIIGIPVVIYFLSGKEVFSNCKYALIVLFVMLGCAVIHQPKPSRFDKIEQYYISENKVAFLIKSFNKDQSFTKDLSSEEIHDAYKTIQKNFRNQQFVDERFPFLHKDNTPDVLSNFFEFKTGKPNIVLIVVEGLGREFSGENSLVPSATPFLDSLSQQGLVWNNCMSTSQRTICALPSILGALPFGKNGFMSYKEGAPVFNSLYTICHQNNYANSFFYGGWLCFDDMCHFLKLNNVDTYLDVSLYDSVSQRNTWGLYDDYMFEKSIQSIDFEKSPRFETYLTLTTHDPFEYPNEEKYCNKYKEMIKHCDTVAFETKLLRSYASYVYLDESVAKLINAYKSKPGFDNTIFIITGDHDFCTWRNPLICHNVPLIIWSPMLTRHKRMLPLVSHRDIAPSVIAMLKHQFNITAPEEETFLNNGLDTLDTFRSLTFSPLMDVGRNLYAFMYKDNFFYDNEVFKITYDNNRLNLSLNDDTVGLKKLVEAYRKLDLYVCEKGMLVPNRYNTSAIDTNVIFMVRTVSDSKKFIKSQNDTFSKNQDDYIVTTQSEFPINFPRYTLAKNDKMFCLRVECDINIPLPANNEELVLVTAIQRNGEQIYWASDIINNSWYSSYDQWNTISTSITLKTDVLELQEGDEVFVYFWNKSQILFSVKNFHIENYTLQ